MTSKIVFSLVIALVLTFGVSTQVWSQGDLTVTVVQAAGKVAYKKAGAGSMIPVQVDVTQLTAGDVIFTGPSSKVTIRVNGKSGPEDGVHPAQTTIEIGPKASVLMTKLFADLTSGNEEIQIGVAEGQVISNVRRINPNSERFEVETPTAIAAVRGTKFLTDVKWNASVPDVGFRVDRGNISLFNKRGSRMANLGEGDMADIDPTGSSASVSATSNATPGAGGGGPGSNAAGGSRGGLGIGGDSTDSDTITSTEVSDDEGDDVGGGRP
jgi:hypothetical protein